MMPLALMSPGEQAEIVDIRLHQQKHDCCGQCGGERHKADYRLEDLGLRVGKTVEMLTNGGGGAILVKVDESRLALGRGMAMKIMVRRAN